MPVFRNLSSSSSTWCRISVEIQFACRVVCGSYHCLAVTITLDIYSWGWNKYGQLGLGGDEARTLPTILKLPASVYHSQNPNSNHLNPKILIPKPQTPSSKSKEPTTPTFKHETTDHLTHGTKPPMIPHCQSQSINPEHMYQVPGFPVEYATSHGHSVMVLQTGDLTFCGVNIWGKNVCQTTARFSPFVTSDSVRLFLSFGRLGFRV